ncbi:MAG: ATP-binding protein [Gammaproteobacteria bacterium]
MRKLKTGKYSGIIFAIALFVLLDAAVLMANFYMAAQFARDTELVNLAARQQTLSQQTVKALLQTDNALGSGNLVDEPLEEFKTSFKLFDETLTAFQNGGEVTTPAGMRTTIEPLTNAALAQHIEDAAAVWSGFKAKAQSIAAFEGSIELDADFEVYDAEGQLEGDMYEAIIYSAENNVSASLLWHINSVAVGLEAQAAQRAQRLRMTQIGGIVLALCAFGIIVFHFLRNLRRSDEALAIAEEEKDEILNTVNEGLFLLDKDMRFGTQYSRAVETIFRRTNLAGEEFLSLLKDIVPEKTLDTARDYVELFFGDRINEKLVQDLNPLDQVEVHFRDVTGGFVTRYLGFGFKRVMVNEDLSHLLVTVNDITEVVGLKRQLDQSQDQGKSQLDMLMDVLHIEPDVLVDFIASADRDLEEINSVLKRQSSSQAEFVEKLDDIFRRTHSVKGESGALGLNSVAKLAHELEERVIALKGNPSLTGGDFLPLTMRLDELMGHMTSIRKLSGDLSKFRTVVAAQSAIDENGQVVDSRKIERRNVPSMLQSLGERLAAEQNKNVEVVCEGFDEIELPAASRKAVKDICVQFVRNGIAHGVETPSQRRAADKDEQGHIALRLTQQDGFIQLAYSDDGCGLQVEKIRAAALSRGFLAADQIHEMNDRQVMSLIFRRGFSTAEQVDGNAGRGVGMDVVRHLIQQLGGKVRMSTVPGQRTSFTVSLPTAVASDEVAA